MSDKNNFNPFNVIHYSYDKCFLCGKDLAGKKTDEHVFPKWLQNKFDLWNKTIHLFNGSQINYKQLTIPCCEECNNNELANLEREISNNLEKGFNSFKNINEGKLFHWIGKIFYGLLFKELSLLEDQSNPEKGNIVEPEFLERFKMLHGFLQSLKIPLIFKRFKPWSIFVYKIYDNGFDYHDNPYTFTFAIRMGEVGIIACLEDNGIIEQEYKDYFSKYQSITLHPIQFDELFVKLAYKISLLKYMPKYSIENEEKTIIELLPFEKENIFEDWDQKEYAKVLSYYWKPYEFEFEDIYYGDNKVASMIKNEKGEVKVLNENGKTIKHVNMD